MDPWLSVVIPVHNGERWLGETLDSVAMQACAGIECVVIDSTPGDGAANLVATYADRLRLRLFRRPDLLHWPAKTNFGFAEAAAAHVSMLHQDDFWLPNRAATLRRWIEAEPGAAMHLHPSRIVDEGSQPLGTWTCPLTVGTPVDPGLLLERLLVQNFIAVPSPLITRDAYLAVGGIDERLWYTGDWDLYLKLARAGPVVYHAEVLAAFRVHGRSMTTVGSRGATEFREQMTGVLEKHITAVPEARRADVRRRALASVGVNAGLAAASNGRPLGIVEALSAVARLGPFAMAAYLRDSRLLERVVPRLRAKLAGHL